MAIQTRRRITELIGDNNGRTIGRARKHAGEWHCEVVPWWAAEDDAIIPTRKAAEQWLREVALATRIIACPEIAR